MISSASFFICIEFHHFNVTSSYNKTDFSEVWVVHLIESDKLPIVMAGRDGVGWKCIVTIQSWQVSSGRDRNFVISLRASVSFFKGREHASPSHVFKKHFVIPSLCSTSHSHPSTISYLAQLYWIRRSSARQRSTTGFRTLSEGEEKLVSPTI